MANLAYQVTGFAYQGAGQFAYQGSVDGGVPTTDGAVWPLPKYGRKRREEIEREQKMVEDYLLVLDERAREERKAKRYERQPARARKAAAAALPQIPELTEAMARAASEVQLRRIAEHAQGEERARKRAAAESRRRRLVAVMLLAIDD